MQMADGELLGPSHIHQQKARTTACLHPIRQDLSAELRNRGVRLASMQLSR